MPLVSDYKRRYGCYSANNRCTATNVRTQITARVLEACVAAPRSPAPSRLFPDPYLGRSSSFSNHSHNFLRRSLIMSSLKSPPTVC